MIGSLLAIALLAAFATGVVARDRLASLFPVALAATDSVPRWISDYATAFCNGDAKKLADGLDPSLNATQTDIEQALGDRQWSCDRMRYVTSSMGQRGTAYMYVMHDSRTNLETWVVFTTQNERIVRID